MSPKIITWIDTMPFVFLVGTCAAIGVGIAPYYLRNRNKSRKRGVGSPHPSSCVKEYSNVIYLDYNATTPIWEEVRDAMLPYTCERFGNPSSLHVYGESSAKCVRDARANIRSLIGACNNHNIVFTSCGTESDNRAIDIALSAARHSRKTSQGKLKYYTPHVVTCSIEHPAVLVYLQHLAYTGEIQLSIVPVDGAGVVSADDVESALSDDTAMVTIMHSNNEVGVLQPIEDIARRVHARKGQYIFVHTDAAQSLGKVPVNVRSLDVDLLTIVGHKFGAPKGVAALYINDRLSSTLDGGVKPLLHGGGQESGWRAGTENTLLLAGLGEAARLAAVELTEVRRHMLMLKERMRRAITEHPAVCRRNVSDAGFLRFNGPSCVGSTNNQLPNTLSVSFRGLKVSRVMAQINARVACSAGSACHAAESLSGSSISPVLAAMGLPREYAEGTLRLSWGRHTSTDDIDQAAEHILGIVDRYAPRTCTSH